MDIDFSQLNALSQQLDRLSKEAFPLARTVTQKVCADTKRDAQAFAPVDTGNLRNSYGYETRELAGGVVGEVYNTASYAHYVEFGTSRMAPRASLGPAFDRHGYAFEKAMGAIAEKFLP